MCFEHMFEVTLSVGVCVCSVVFHLSKRTQVQSPPEANNLKITFEMQEKLKEFELLCNPR